MRIWHMNSGLDNHAHFYRTCGAINGFEKKPIQGEARVVRNVSKLYQGRRGPWVFWWIEVRIEGLHGRLKGNFRVCDNCCKKLYAAGGIEVERAA